MKNMSSMDMNHMNHMDHMGHMGNMDNMGRMDTDMGGDMSNNGTSTDGGGGGMMMMQMYFYASVDATILFEWWKTGTVWELLLSMLAIFVMAFLYEGLKYFRDALFQRTLHSSQYTSTSKNNITITDGQQPIRYMEQIIMPSPLGMMSKGHFIQTFLHMLQFLLSYFLMLIFMTYNVWLCLACLLGAGTGYFFFGWRKSVVVDITEHCH